MTYLTDDEGSITKTYEYDAFGNEEDPAATDTNPFRYAGEYYDKETGTYYLRARYYDPVIGRFTQEDPARHSTNWYLYCYCNPIRYVDPGGEIPVETIIDFASLGWSLRDFVSNPSWGTFGILAWDALAFITPYAPGSYAGKSLKAGSKILSKSDDYLKTGVWLMPSFKRGYEIEKALGGWGNNFPVIDWAKQTIDGKHGILENLKSIKSLDITAKTYQSPAKLKSTLKKYIDSLSNYQGGNVYNGVRWSIKEGTERTLESAVPAVEMTSRQANVFQEMFNYAQGLENRVDVVIKIVS